MTTDLKPQMPRTPSAQTLDSLVHDLGDKNIAVEERKRRILSHFGDYFQGSNENQVINKGRRLLDRDLALPRSWGAMRHAIADALMPALKSRSPHATNACKVVEQLQVPQTLQKSLDAIFGALGQEMPPSAVAQYQAMVMRGLHASCITERMALYYAEHASHSCLQAALGADAHLGTVLSGRIIDHLGECIEEIQKTGPLPPLTATEQEKINRVQEFMEVTSADSLQQLSQFGPDIFERLRRKLFVLIADSSTPEELARLVAFGRTPAGREYQQRTNEAMAMAQKVILAEMSAVMGG